MISKQEYERLAAFRYQLRRFLRFSEDAVHQYGVTHLQYLLLLHLKGFPGREWATISELAERLQSHHHGVVSLVTRCEQHGLVVKTKDATDKREVHVHLTEEGERLIAILARLHRDELTTLQGIFDVPHLFE